MTINVMGQMLLPRLTPIFNIGNSRISDYAIGYMVTLSKRG